MALTKRREKGNTCQLEAEEISTILAESGIKHVGIKVSYLPALPGIHDEKEEGYWPELDRPPLPSKPPYKKAKEKHTQVLFIKPELRLPEDKDTPLDKRDRKTVEIFFLNKEDRKACLADKHHYFQNALEEVLVSWGW